MHDMALAMARMCVLCLLPLLVIPAHAQKKEKACEVVARVNGHPITEAAYLAALRDYRKDFSWQMEMRNKSQREIDAELKRRKPTLLDDLIDEFLLAQRGKELGFDGDGELERIENAIDPDSRDNFSTTRRDCSRAGNRSGAARGAAETSPRSTCDTDRDYWSRSSIALLITSGGTTTTTTKRNSCFHPR